MITEKDGEKFINCDKCLLSRIMSQGDLLVNGWTVNSSARKYKHLCWNCKTKKEKDTFNFVRDKFGY